MGFGWGVWRMGRGIDVHEADAEEDVEEVALASGHLEALDDFHWQQGDGAVGDDVDASVCVPVECQLPAQSPRFSSNSPDD